MFQRLVKGKEPALPYKTPAPTPLCDALGFVYKLDCTLKQEESLPKLSPILPIQMCLDQIVPFCLNFLARTIEHHTDHRSHKMLIRFLRCLLCSIWIYFLCAVAFCETEKKYLVNFSCKFSRPCYVTCNLWI